MAVLRRGFDVFGIVVATADDDQILESPRDEQLAVKKEPQIPCAQERSTTGIREERRERLLCLARLAPVPLRDSAAAEPDLPDPTVRTAHPGIRIDDDNFYAVQRGATAYERDGGRVFRRDADHVVLAQRHRINVAHQWHDPIP
ncbi:hypothetical protein NIIDMKKI_12330 [Mycobacterium kansasii]|uniref:Uncharacterized protein n=2 Tax=Mycobacterium TaxID=1763 RepID=A0A7G1I4V4_MYCKA|nr:hypothetical protein NIIDMKKI_12330 [Mycobacterium kansasii]